MYMNRPVAEELSASNVPGFYLHEMRSLRHGNISINFCSIRLVEYQFGVQIDLHGRNVVNRSGRGQYLHRRVYGCIFPGRANVYSEIDVLGAGRRGVTIGRIVGGHILAETSER